MKKEITLSKRKEIQSLQELLIKNADGEKIEMILKDFIMHI